MGNKINEEIAKEDSLNGESVLRLILLLEYFLRLDLTGCSDSLESICGQLLAVTTSKSGAVLPQKTVIKATKVKLITELLLAKQTVV